MSYSTPLQPTHGETTNTTQMNNGNIAAPAPLPFPIPIPRVSTNGSGVLDNNLNEPEPISASGPGSAPENVIPPHTTISDVPMSETPPNDHLDGQLGGFGHPPGGAEVSQLSGAPAYYNYVDDSSSSSAGTDDIMSDSDGGAMILHPPMETDEYDSEEEESEEYEEYEDHPVLQAVQGMSDSDDEGQYEETMAEFQSYASTTFQTDAHHIPHPDYYPHSHPHQTLAPPTSAAQSSTLQPPTLQPSNVQPLIAPASNGPTSEPGHGAIVDSQTSAVTPWGGQPQTLQGSFPPNFAPTFFPGDPPPLIPGEEGLEAFMPSHGNSDVTGSQNFDLLGFVRSWARIGGVHLRHRSGQPFMHNVLAELNRLVREVTYNDLSPNGCDIQGLNWQAIGTTRSRARFRRHASYRNYVNIPGSDHIGPSHGSTWLTPSENYFRFRRTLVRTDVHLSHFQLRSVLASPSRSQVYYGTRRGIVRLNPITQKTSLVVNNKHLTPLDAKITALDATSDVIVGGTFTGEYCIKSARSEDNQKPSEGQVTTDRFAITTHIDIHNPRRSSSPVAAMTSNDKGFRMLDLTTEQFTLTKFYDVALNCSALSPDGRLRILVGDNPTVNIINVDTGAIEAKLKSHTDYGFSCAWSEDGHTVATGYQDKRIKIWDARKWNNSNGDSTPVESLLCEMAGARSLKFSPLGSGEPVLVAAEEADFINIIDTKRWKTKQMFDVFGEIGGTVFTEDGYGLNVLISDRKRGGLIQLDRVGTNRLTQWVPHMPSLQPY